VDASDKLFAGSIPRNRRSISDPADISNLMRWMSQRTWTRADSRRNRRS